MYNICYWAFFNNHWTALQWTLQNCDWLKDKQKLQLVGRKGKKDVLGKSTVKPEKSVRKKLVAFFKLHPKQQH